MAIKKFCLLLTFFSLFGVAVYTQLQASDKPGDWYAEGKKILERGIAESQFETVSNAIEYFRKAEQMGVDSRLELGTALFYEDLLWNRQTTHVSEKNESFLMRFKDRTRIGVLLLHDIQSSPAEVYPLGKALYQKGFTVYAPRLAGHGINPGALARVGPTDWRKNYLLGYEILNLLCDKVYVVGSGWGGVLALELAIKNDLSGVITLNAPMNLKGIGKNFFFLAQFTGLSVSREFPSDMRVFSYNKIPYSTLNQLDNIRGYVKGRLAELTEPIAIFQSRNDKIVSSESADIIYDSVRSREKKIFWLNNAPHYLLSSTNKGRRLVINEMFRFINNNNR